MSAGGGGGAPPPDSPAGRLTHTSPLFFVSPVHLIRQGQRILQVGRHGDCGDRLDSRVGSHQHHEGGQRPVKKTKNPDRQDLLIGQSFVHCTVVNTDAKNTPSVAG